ncbi:type II toxin-antitoxin system PemK/MazF family toxin [Leifsonia sp. Root112D2]|jgi:mRNA interferase MazF|uniref:type II toxin-antitoxin system PemK/MazF family toxin n=1 Tax=Leifsonia sp. Root112D2 TaxID=1736426 RepID=UPI0007000D9E|nr:type II toxin-antitoxin system PemK/MazF family toxin [Leifsonia sp. Root112D2]KQV07594.1 hypothetical protein ASC63_10155 [Leifsonia sp. Root112D2]
MGRVAVGDIVTVSFPYSDGSGVKRRPALVLAEADERDVVLCQITSRRSSSPNPVPLRRTDLASGALPIDSFIRPEKLFTASRASLEHVVAAVSTEVLSAARSTAAALLSS